MTTNWFLTSKRRLKRTSRSPFPRGFFSSCSHPPPPRSEHLTLGSAEISRAARFKHFCNNGYNRSYLKLHIFPVPLHFAHHRSKRPDAVPLLFLHGWLGSFMEVGPTPLAGILLRVAGFRLAGKFECGEISSIRPIFIFFSFPSKRKRGVGYYTLLLGHSSTE